MSDDEFDDPLGKIARLHPPRIPHHPALDRAVQGLIGAQLRNMYEHYLEQPIPPRLLDLVQRLAEDGSHDSAHAQEGEGGSGP